MSDDEKRQSIRGLLGQAGKEVLQRGADASKAIKEANEPRLKAVGGATADALKKGVDASLPLKRAHDLHRAAEADKEQAEEEFQRHLQDVHVRGAALAAQKDDVMASSVARFVRLWERQQKRANVSEKDFELHLNITPEEVQAFQGMKVRAVEIARGMGTAVVAGAATGTGVAAAVTAFGAASTGTAISTLSGAAAHSALLAWLGGGSLAAGGGGMALGSLVLGGLFVAPAAVVGTVLVTKKGQEALTAATAYAAEVEVYAAQLEAKRVDLTGIERRMGEISALTTELNFRLREAIAVCEADERWMEGTTRPEHFFAAASLAKTLTDLISVPVIDEDLRASLASDAAVVKAQGSLGS